MTRTRALLAAVCLMLVGCRHKQMPSPVIPPPSPVAMAGEPGPKTPSLLPTETLPSAPVATVPVVPGAPAKKAKKKVVPAAPVDVAAETPPPAPPSAPPPSPVAIGGLISEGGSTTASLNTVMELILANDRRMGGLSKNVREQQKAHIVMVRNFQVDARKALAGGDVEGAMTLATKAGVLLDEIAK